MDAVLGTIVSTINSIITQSTDTIVNGTSDTIGSVVNETLAKNGTSSVPATPEGMFISCISLALMALFPIVVGSFKSVAHQAKQQVEIERTGQAAEQMTSKDAMMFPLIASCALFGLYMLFRIFSKEYINLLMTGYFMVIGGLAMAHVVAPVLRKLIPERVLRNTPFHLSLRKTCEGEKEGGEENVIDFQFDTIDIVSFLVSSGLAVWYLMKKHWIANNVFGISFAINGVELLQLSSVSTGCILLGGLFFYDIFWVFGTDVMVTVAMSFEAPIKLIFPRDFIERGLFGTNFAMLGLGDIVIPGIFIALLLRFDKSLGRGRNTYFNASFLAYIIGLVTTFIVMIVFKHAQPALLYLVPACISFPLGLAAIKGDIPAMFAYQDHPDPPQDQTGDSNGQTGDSNGQTGDSNGQVGRLTRSAAKKEE